MYIMLYTFCMVLMAFEVYFSLYTLLVYEMYAVMESYNPGS